MRTAPPALRGEGRSSEVVGQHPRRANLVASAEHVATHQRRYPATNRTNAPTSQISPSACSNWLSRCWTHRPRQRRPPVPSAAGKSRWGRVCVRPGQGRVTGAAGDQGTDGMTEAGREVTSAGNTKTALPRASGNIGGLEGQERWDHHQRRAVPVRERSRLRRTLLLEERLSTSWAS
jgi:hypothetical protein